MRKCLCLFLLLQITCLQAQHFRNLDSSRPAVLTTGTIRFEYEELKKSLLPLPQKIDWKDGNGILSLKRIRTIIASDSNLKTVASYLRETLIWKNIFLSSDQKSKTGFPVILQYGKVIVPLHSEEAYRLNVQRNRIIITANTAHGIFNGIQTLLQLANEEGQINICTITDWPAFSWRGYMVDVGRNYMSMNLLKQQIDMMAAYKLNVFHFHATEDIAWRLETRLYPQLHAADNMIRNKGSYYSENEIRELINYCKERFIQFVPEIDMPGHSAAFKRAMHTDMQSDTGIRIVKNIIKEFCDNYDLPYFHIGADEVKITNKNFVPEITELLEGMGKKVIGWQPGGNFSPNTIRQLWMENGSTMKTAFSFPAIDSRHLYINHFDPLESVVTIFYRKIGNKITGDSLTLGGTLCLWNDRAVSGEDDLLKMNPVFPSMLAFAERSWRGGGQNEWVANIDDSAKTTFGEFEDRLLENKKRFFTHLPFAYVRQTSVSWKLFGPYENGGQLSARFAPEILGDTSQLKIYDVAIGGTIILRHFWYPIISGAIETPSENTTFYASRNIYSSEEGYKNFWIGFNNLSRSYASSSPPAGKWDDRGSAVWVNGKLIAPPDWKRAGGKGDMEIPLIDEGYEFRPPSRIFLKKGWNQVLIKAPVAKFKSNDWQSPVKWMFTFVEAGI